MTFTLPKMPLRRRTLVALASVLAGLLLLLALTAAPGFAKERLKAWILEHPDPDCAVSAAIYDEQRGLDRLKTGLRIAAALPAGSCGGIPGPLARSAAPTTDGQVTGNAESEPSAQLDSDRPNAATPVPTVVYRQGSLEAAIDHNRGPRTVLRPAPDRDPLSAFDIPSARKTVAQLRFDQLGQIATFDQDSGLERTEYSLPLASGDDPTLAAVLGTRLPTLAGDVLPDDVVAIHVVPPTGTRARLGPFVWSRTPDDALRLYGMPMLTNYRALGYPDRLLAEIFLNSPSPDGDQFRPTDRVGDFAGAEIDEAAIEHGAVYLCAEDDGSWRLHTYPALPAAADCVNLVWPFTDGAAFEPPAWLVKEQTAHQVISAEQILNGEPAPRNIGPSVIFRTDLRAPYRHTDLFVVAPFLYLDNPGILKDIVMRAPLRDGTAPDPRQLIVAAGDLHYVAFGELRPLLDGDFGLRPMGPRPRGTDSLDFDARANRIAVYLGLFDTPPDH